jgi:outer membrane lipoprotein-sorting protein
MAFSPMPRVRERRRMLITKDTIRGLIIVGMMCALVNACRSERQPEVTGTPTPQQSIANSTEKSSASSPITWNEVASAYEHVADYVCLYEKIEKAISKGEEQKIRLSFRKPFDVRMDWLDTRGRVTQTAVYRQGLNDGKVLARQNGLLGSLAGTMRLDPNESLALSDSRHPITEVGIGKIIERAQHDSTNRAIASHFDAEEILDGRPAYKFEFTASGNEAVGGLSNAHRAILWIDRELKLPTRLELYDGANVLLESHHFKGIHLNQKIGDTIFTMS